MTQEDKRYLQDKLCRVRDKELLLKDLCARLPYGVKIQVNDKIETVEGINILDNIVEFGTYMSCDIEEVKPYLFPLSSMTEEQQAEFDRTYANDMIVVSDNLKNRLDGQPYEMNLGHYRHIDWLNANHLDYRGLIEKGLAIDATGKNIY